MSTPWEIPLTPKPQTMQIFLAGVQYQLTFKWCAPAACWVVDFATADGTPVLSGVALVTGVNLLDQFAYLVFSGGLVAQTDHDADAVPTYENLGETGRAYFLSDL